MPSTSPSSGLLPSRLARLFLILFAFVALGKGPVGLAAEAGPSHTFAIGDSTFLLDGKTFVVRCGEIHFARVPREYWKQRLQMCHAMGLNTVCVYLFWNFHEPEPGKFDWSGQADVAEFCKLAQSEGLWVILRPGPIPAPNGRWAAYHGSFSTKTASNCGLVTPRSWFQRSAISKRSDESLHPFRSRMAVQF